MVIGDVRIFKKSGNEVQLMAPVLGASPAAWTVRRTTGASAGKEMVCLERALLTREQFFGEHE